jgi:RNA polymerase sigma factor (sigma-70 family)
VSTTEFSQLLVNNTDYLKPFAFTLTRDIESARDLMQETLCRAWANREKYRPGTNVKAWMYTIMRNIFINDYRKRSRQPTVLDHSTNDYLLDHNQPVTGTNPEIEMNARDIRRSIHSLPQIFLHPFILYYEGYKYHEIAELLKEPLGTIKSRIHFARKLLKEQIVRDQ